MFTIDQIALRVTSEAAQNLLIDMGAKLWHYDLAEAEGTVNGISGENAVDSRFSFDFSPEKLEVELMRYLEGPNWLADKPGAVVACLGMYCEEVEIEGWKRFFEEHEIKLVQESWTKKHTHLERQGKRRYHYCIFETRELLGVDLKFIVKDPV